VDTASLGGLRELNNTNLNSLLSIVVGRVWKPGEARGWKGLGREEEEEEEERRRGGEEEEDQQHRSSWEKREGER
jgi:hypothetical protein